MSSNYVIGQHIIHWMIYLTAANGFCGSCLIMCLPQNSKRKFGYTQTMLDKFAIGLNNLRSVIFMCVCHFTRYFLELNLYSSG